MEKILVVDDEPLALDLLLEELKGAGYQTVLACSGKEAMARISKGGIDLVLLDDVMPEMSGIEVLRWLRQMYSIADLPVIMVRTMGRREALVESLKLGANDFIVKPIDMPILMARVETQFQMRRLIKLQDEFLRIASHDLKGPLQSVLSFASLLSRRAAEGQPLDAEDVEMLSNVEIQAREMGHIVEEFLDFQRIDSGNLELAFSRCDLNAMAADVLEDCQHYAKSKGMHACVEIDPGVPRVWADAIRLRQVIRNLIDNAIKFSPQGARIEVRTHACAEAVRLEVADTGPGLTDADHDLLFTKYAKLSNRPTGNEKSYGLGLAICKQLIELHGGEIGAQGNSQGGSVFWFQIPTERPRRGE